MSLFSEDAMELQALRAGWKEKQEIIKKQAAELAAALAACKAKDEAILQENYSLALSFQPDDAALKAWLGEPVAEVDDSGVVIVCRYDYKPKDKFYSPKGLK